MMGNNGVKHQDRGQPGQIRPQWSIIVASVLLVLLTTVTLINSPQEAEQNKRTQIIPTTFNQSPLGYDALAQMLRKSAVPLQVYRGDFNQLHRIPAPATMVMIGPMESTAEGRHKLQTPEDSQKLLDWVCQGNTAIVLDDFEMKSAQTLLAPVTLSSQHASVSTRSELSNALRDIQKDPSPENLKKHKNTLRALQPLTPGKGWKPQWGEYLATTSPPTVWDYPEYYFAPVSTLPTGKTKTTPSCGISHATGLSEENGYQVLLQDEALHPVLISAPWGNGQLILGTLPYLASNEMLSVPLDYAASAAKTLKANPDKDFTVALTPNFQFLTNLITSPQQPIYLNEFIHGYFDKPDYVLGYFYQTPIGRLIDQSILWMVAIFWLSALSWRPLRTHYEQQGGVDIQALIRSLSSIFYARRSAALVLGPQLRQLDHNLHRRFQFTLLQLPHLKPGSVSVSGTPSQTASEPLFPEQLDAQQQERLDDILSLLLPEEKRPALRAAMLESLAAVAHDQTLSHTRLLHLSQKLCQLQDTLSHGQRLHHRP